MKTIIVGVTVAVLTLGIAGVGQYKLAEAGVLEPIGFKAYGRSQVHPPEEMVRRILCSFPAAEVEIK